MNLELGLEQPAREQDRPYSVTELVEGARQTIQLLPAVWVEGEVSGWKEARQGQCYFTLKDGASAIECVIWADEARRLKAKPEDGVKVFVRGKLAVFPKKGQLQLTVSKLLATVEGGPAALALEQARQALEKDGLLDPARKRELPAYPSCVGVVTSPEGAAWHDIVAVVARRWPYCELVLVGARVQGVDAPRQLVKALALADRCHRLDVLIVGRGGGSKEDLAAFNDERVARAVAASRAPTISAVGHETDITLTDLVADVRAPTPSAAAEKAVPDAADLARRLGALRLHLSQAVGGRLDSAIGRLALVRSRMAGSVSRRTQRVEHFLKSVALRMGASCAARVTREAARAERLGAGLEAMSPLKVLDRGYAVARDASGRVLRRTADFAPKQPFRLRVADGEVRARTEESA